MNKVAIITDQHFGARSDSPKFLDYYEKFYTNTFFPTLKQQGIDTVLILGDTFDRRKYVNFGSLSRSKEMFFDPLEQAGIDVYMLVGNHDTFHKNTNDINSPELLLTEYSNITPIPNPVTINVKGIDICMIPWICAENQEACFTEMQTTKSDICMGHFEIAGFAMYRGNDARDGIDTKTFERFDVVFSGHYHHKSSQGQIHYLGNPYELTWQDHGDPRGFHLFNLETRELEFIENPYTMFERIEYDDSKGTPTFEVDSVKDKYVKLVVVNKTDYYKYDQYLQRLYESGCHEIKIIEDMSEFEAGDINEEISLEDTVSVLSNYIDSVETDMNKDKLKSFMRNLYTEALNVEDSQ